MSTAVTSSSQVKTPVLDLSRLAVGAAFRVPNGGGMVDLPSILGQFPRAVELVTGEKPTVRTRGVFAVADPTIVARIIPHQSWNDPKRLVYGYTTLDGGDWRQLLADAIRIMRLTARLGVDSINLRLPMGDALDSLERQRVGDHYRWGNIQEAGAVWRAPDWAGRPSLLGVTCGFEPHENHAITEVMLSLVAAAIARVTPP
ncbi:MAG TPA: hypothetical protein PLY16_00705 [Candidatus Saccharibacteria bacterium]|nr:hypothetical protein [Candidatus Saccharibacteria bacterium]